jgi:hypothetical protein
MAGALALVGLCAAYLTWQRPKDTVKADVVQVFNATKQSLEKVHYEDGTRFVDLDKRGDTAPRLWVTLGFLPGKTPVFDAGMSLVSMDGGVDGGALLVSVKPPEPLPTREMYANERAETLFTRFTPFEATRALGSLPKEKLDELGLVGSERHLAVTVAGQVHKLLVSKPLSGVIGSYLQDEQSGEVYLVQGSVFTELDPTSQMLVDRRLHTFKQSEFDAFTLALDGKVADYVQTNADIPQTAKVARAETPDKAEELVKNWHDKIWNRLVVTEVLGKGEAPKHGEPKVALHLEYRSRGTKKGWLEIGFDGTQGTWARSENTPSWVAVHQGTEEIILEAKRFMP